MKKSNLVMLVLVGLMLATSCSNFNQSNKTEKNAIQSSELPTFYAEGADTLLHHEYDAYKQVNTSYTSCKTGKQIPYEKNVKNGTASFDDVVRQQGQKIDQDALLSMLASAGFVKDTDTWTTLPWNWLQWLLFLALLLILGMLLLWLLRRIWHAINQPLPPYVAYQQPIQYAQQQVVQPVAPAPAPVSPATNGSTIIHNYSGGIIMQMANSTQPASGFTKKSTSFEIKGKFDEEWS